jgi:hypothetical protein
MQSASTAAAATTVHAAPAVSARVNPRQTGVSPCTRPAIQQPDSKRAGSGKALRWSKKGGLEALERDIVSVIEDLNIGQSEEEMSQNENDILLVVDQPDLLLAATGPGMGCGATEMSEMIMALRQVQPCTVCLKRPLLTSMRLVSAACPFYHRHSIRGYTVNTQCIITVRSAYALGNRACEFCGLAGSPVQDGDAIERAGHWRCKRCERRLTG